MQRVSVAVVLQRVAWMLARQGEEAPLMFLSKVSQALVSVAHLNVPCCIDDRSYIYLHHSAAVWSPEHARKAAETEVDGIVVSNQLLWLCCRVCYHQRMQGKLWRQEWMALSSQIMVDGS